MTKIFSGNIVPGDNIIDINTSNYPKGIYFVRIKGLKVEKTLKLVVAE
jgi:hypothetical protein